MKLTVGLFFGGRSVEHEVSVITALQAYEHLDKNKYHIIPIYVSKDGAFFTNPKFLNIKNFKDVNPLLLSSKQLVLANKNGQGGFLTQGFFSKFTPLDIAFPLFHGSFGEDGAFQGMCEIYRLPYIGFNVAGSAIGMDKAIQKLIFQQLGLGVGKYITISRSEWEKDQKKVVKKINNELTFPVFVKPTKLGSSIGVNLAKNQDALTFAIEVAAIYCDKILIEEAFKDVIEVNCSALGFGEDTQASVCEMPTSSGLLSFEDKYKKGGKGGKSSGMASLSRLIPAPVSEKLTKQIQAATIKIFKALDGCGVARVDYFVSKADKSSSAYFVEKQTETFWVNEINTIPGSLSYYLWEKSGIKYPELLDKLIEHALKRFEDQKKTQYVFNSGLLSQIASKKS